MDIRTRNANADQDEEEGEEQEDLLTAFDRHLRTVNRLFDERRQKQQERNSLVLAKTATTTTTVHSTPLLGAVQKPQGLRSLLVSAVRKAQINNVKHMLTDSSPEMITAVWERETKSNDASGACGGDNGDTLFDEMVKSTSEKHKEIMHLLKAYMAKHPLHIVIYQ